MASRFKETRGDVTESVPIVTVAGAKLPTPSDATYMSQRKLQVPSMLPHPSFSALTAPLCFPGPISLGSPIGSSGCSFREVKLHDTVRATRLSPCLPGAPTTVATVSLPAQEKRNVRIIRIACSSVAANTTWNPAPHSFARYPGPLYTLATFLEQFGLFFLFSSLSAFRFMSLFSFFNDCFWRLSKTSYDIDEGVVE